MKDLADRIDDIEELFNQADADNDDAISLTEFRTLMQELENSMSASSVDACFAKVDADHNGRISLAEFRSWWLTGSAIA